MTSREFNLAVACCRYSFAAEQAENVDRLAEAVDWERFMALSRRHRVQGLVARGLLGAEIAVPREFSDAITADAVSVAERNLRLASAADALAEEFGKASIDLLFVKGLSLSALVYADPFIKMSADIDILIDPSEVIRSAQLLHEFGYRPIFPRDASADELRRWHARNKESAWLNSERDVVLELHTRLADNPVLIPGICMSSPRQLVEIGSGAPVGTLTNDDLFAYLCVHGASSAWFRLKWIVDLAALIYRSGEAKVEALHESAVARGAGRAPAQALLLADRFSLVRLPDHLRTKLRRDPLNLLLETVAVRQLLRLREPTDRWGGTASIHLSQALLGPGWSFAVSEISRQMHGFPRRRVA